MSPAPTLFVAWYSARSKCGMNRYIKRGCCSVLYNSLKLFQVTTLVNTKGPSKKKKGRSKRAHVLVAAVEKATENFIEKGELIAYENPDIKQEMLSAVEEVRKTGIKKLCSCLRCASPFELSESFG